MTRYRNILYELDGGVATIKLNQPDSLNAMTLQMAQELLDAVRCATNEARAILIGAVGRTFSAGANLNDDGFRLDDPQRDAGQDLDGTIHPLLMEMRGAEIPVITMVRGAAAGVGCSVALAGDLILASESAVFLQAFRHVGLGPDGGASYLLTRAIGRVRAMELLLLGEKLPVAKALEWGLINRLMPDDALDAAALELARELARGPRSLGHLKRAAWSALDAPLETVLMNERRWQREASRTSDFVEGITAFREKRRPRFTGK